eukprot:Rmarinus@m.2834
MEDTGVLGIMTAVEAEGMVERLEPFEIDVVGSGRWMTQQENAGKLNIQAHHNAIHRGDEFVMEALISYDKISVIVHELVVLELWKEKVFPHILEYCAEKHHIKAHSVLHHEAALCNLLEVVLFHKEAMECAGEALVDLSDYCYRKIIRLLEIMEPVERTKSAEDYMKESTTDHLKEQVREIEFSCGMCCLSIVRYMSDYAAVLPVSVVKNLFDDRDFVMALIPVMEKAPWRKRTPKGFMKYSDGKWEHIDEDNLPKLVRHEAQVWLALNNFVCDPTFKAKYDWNSYRKDQMTRLRRYCNEVLLDQIPPLADLFRHIEQLAVMEPPPATHRAMVVVEQVGRLRDLIQDGKSESYYRELAEKCKTDAFEDTEESRKAEIERMAALYNMNNLDEILEDPKCAKCGKEAAKRCSRCKTEWYCGRECQVAAWEVHKSLCDIIIGVSKDAGSK